MDYSYLIDEQKIVYSTLKNMIEKGHVPHAFIFYGDKSTSKVPMTKYFIKMIYAKELNLEIDSDPVFKRIDDDSSTNIYWIRKDKKTTISTDLVKDYMKESYSKSLEDGPRFYIFEDADDMNINASNAILKFVEEPIDDIYIIFLVENLSKLLDTIISRCVLLSFKPLNKDNVYKKLLDKGYEEEVLKVITSYAQNEDEIEEIFTNNNMLRLFSLSSDMFRENFESRGSIILYINDNYNLITESNKTQDFFLSLVILYLKDVLNTTISISYEPLFRSEKDRIKRISTLFKRDDISSYLKELIDIKTNINSGKPFNFHLYLDDLFLRMELAARK